MLLFHKPVYADLDVDFYFLRWTGIPVPFFVEEFTGMTDTTARVKFMDVEDEIKASRLVNKRGVVGNVRWLSQLLGQGGDWLGLLHRFRSGGPARCTVGHDPRGGRCNHQRAVRGGS